MTDDGVKTLLVQLFEEAGIPVSNVELCRDLFDELEAPLLILLVQLFEEAGIPVSRVELRKNAFNELEALLLIREE